MVSGLLPGATDSIDKCWLARSVHKRARPSTVQSWTTKSADRVVILPEATSTSRIPPRAEVTARNRESGDQAGGLYPRESWAPVVRRVGTPVERLTIQVSPDPVELRITAMFFSSGDRE